MCPPFFYFLKYSNAVYVRSNSIILFVHSIILSLKSENSRPITLFVLSAGSCYFCILVFILNFDILFFRFLFPSFALNKFIFFFSPCFLFPSFFGHSSLFCRIKKEAIVLENNCFFLKNFISFFMKNFGKLDLRDTKIQFYSLNLYPTPQIVSIY